MVQKSGDHQLRLVVYPIICKVLAPSQVVVWDFWTINSMPSGPSAINNFHPVPPEEDNEVDQGDPGYLIQSERWGSLFCDNQVLPKVA